MNSQIDYKTNYFVLNLTSMTNTEAEEFLEKNRINALIIVDIKVDDNCNLTEQLPLSTINYAGDILFLVSQFKNLEKNQRWFDARNAENQHSDIILNVNTGHCRDTFIHNSTGKRMAL